MMICGDILVPRGRAPFGQHQALRPLALPLAEPLAGVVAGSNVGSPRFTDSRHATHTQSQA